MQFPASAISGSGAQNNAENSSSLIGTPAEGAAAKKKEVAPFAAVLAEQAPSVSALKGGSFVPGTKEDISELVLSGSAMNSRDALIPSLRQPRMVKGIFSDPQSDDATPAKDKIKTAQNRKAAPTSSDEPRKKQQATAASDPALPSAAMAPVPAMPMVMEEGPHFTAKSSPNHSPTSQIASAAHDQKLEAQVSEATAPVNSEFAKPEETLLLVTGSLPHEIEPNSIPTAKAQLAPSSTAVINVAQAGSQVVQLHNLAQKLQDASPAGLDHGVNIAAVSPAGQAAVQGVAASSAADVPQKFKLQNKTSDDAAHKLDKLSGSGTAPTAGPVSSSINSFNLALSTHAATDDLSAKPANALAEANAFQRLDAGESPATLLHGGPHQVIVGVHDPSLGWVEVQTQSSAGHVSATLTTASLEAHANLAAQAPAITQYLADRNVSVHSVNVHAQGNAQNGGPGSGQPQSGSGGAYQGSTKLRNIGVRTSNQALPNETGNGNMPQALSASRISVRV